MVINEGKLVTYDLTNTLDFFYPGTRKGSNMKQKSPQLKFRAMYMKKSGTIGANLQITYAPEGIKFDFTADSPGLSISEFNEKYKNSLEPLEFILHFVNEKTGQSAPLGLDIRKYCRPNLQEEQTGIGNLEFDISGHLKKIGL
jgi:hypothetical protein